MGLLKNLRKLRFAAGLAALALSATVATAQTPMSYVQGGNTLFNIKVPDFWEARVGGPRLLTAPGDSTERNVARVLGLTPEGAENVWVGFIVPEGVRNLEEGADYVREIGPQMVRDAEVSKREVRRIGGMTAHSVTGKGRRNGRNVQFTAVLIDLPGPRVAFSVTVLENGFDPALLEGINAIYDSFRASR